MAAAKIMKRLECMWLVIPSNAAKLRCCMYEVQANPSPDGVAIATDSTRNHRSTFTIAAAFTTGAMMAPFECQAAGRRAAFN
jgi:hypothetical protein